VLGIDFALRRGLVHVTVLIDAETGRWTDVIPGRTTDAAGDWLREHPGAEVVCRAGSGAYGEAARRDLPSAAPVSDRWPLWHGLGEAVRKEIAAHSACGAKGMPLTGGRAGRDHPAALPAGPRPARQGRRLLECARRLGLSLNTARRSRACASSSGLAGAESKIDR
jgi:hypothetical protein